MAYQTMECYSTLKRNELSRPEKIWGNLKYTPLRERSPSEKAPYYIITTIRHCGKGKAMEIVKRSVGWGKEGMNRQSREDF